jgi:hypothetical protein
MGTITELVRAINEKQDIGGADFIEYLVSAEPMATALRVAGVKTDALIDAVKSLGEESARGAELRQTAAQMGGTLGSLAPAPTMKGRMSDLALEFVGYTADPGFAERLKQAAERSPEAALRDIVDASPLRTLPKYTTAILEAIQGRVVDRGADEGQIRLALQALANLE